jgi:hypothetical protein
VDQPQGAGHYVFGDPVNALDPLGLGCFSSFASFGHCTIGAAKTVGSGAVDVVNYAIASSPAGVAASAFSRATGITVGGCVGGSAAVLIHGTANLCWVATPSGQTGFTFTLGGGGGYGGISALAGPVFSNAQDMCELSRKFDYAEGSAGTGPVTRVGGQVAVGQRANGQTIWTAEPGWAPALRVGPPVSGGGGVSYTWTFG